MNLDNISKVKFHKSEDKAYTLKQLQEIYDSFDEDSKPSVEGLINYLKGQDENYIKK
jgi:uncharacterized protein (UPF0297 family)